MSERRVIAFSELRRMLPQQIDKLPSVAEFRAMVGKGKKRHEVRLCMRWVGFGWVEEGEADGTEPLLVVEG